MTGVTVITINLVTAEPELNAVRDGVSRCEI